MTIIILAAYLLFCAGMVTFDYRQWKRQHRLRGDTLLLWQTKANRTWRVVYRIRSRYSIYSRFGGGWNWKVGAELGGNAICVFLLIAELYIMWGVKPQYWADRRETH